MIKEIEETIEWAKRQEDLNKEDMLEQVKEDIFSIIEKSQVLNEDDLYEIEKVLDQHAGYQNMELNRLCETATHEEAVKKESHLNKSIEDIKSAYDRITEIRAKLENQRKRRL